MANSRKIHSGNDSETLSDLEIAQARERAAAGGLDVDSMSDGDIQEMVLSRARHFLEDAPTTAADAATIILDGVKAERWRILVGRDAHRIDELVRRSPERAYEVEFFENFANEVGWRLGAPMGRKPASPDT